MNSYRARRLIPTLACLLLLIQGVIQGGLPEDPVKAYIDTIRTELADGKVRLINQTLRLSDEEAKAFWPLYQKYEIELFVIGDRRLELIESFVSAHRAGTLDDSQAEKIAAMWFEQEAARLELLKKYHRLIHDQLSSLRAIQFIQIENRINMVIDIMIASELPLFRHSGANMSDSSKDISASLESGASMSDLPSEGPQEVSVKVSWRGDYPVAAMDRLPAGQRKASTGCIGDAEAFAAVWRAFKPDETVPQVDFESDCVVFARNLDFYNLTRIIKVQITGGVLQVLAAETMSAAPIKDKVAMALAVIPRRGVRAVLSGGKEITVK